MKKLLLTLSCGLFAAQSFAQTPMTLDINNARTNPSGIDTLFNAQLTFLPSLNPGTNVSWDFTTALYNPKLYFSEYMPNTGVGSATHSTLVYFDFKTGITYQTNSMFKVESSGMNVYGEKIIRQAFLIPNSGPTDSIIVNAQSITYSSPKKVLAYPATYNTTWTSDFTYNTALTLKYNPVYPNTPSERRSHVKSKSTVNGWGNAKVNELYTLFKSGAMPVLLVQTADTVTDSFYINGTPAPALVLSTIGLSQGQKSYLYQRNLYRANELTPLVSVTYNDPNYTSVKDANIHRHRLAPSSVKDLNLDDKVAIYPNPVSGREVTVEIADAKAGSWSYEMVNINGQKIAASVLDVRSGKARISLDATVDPGIYFINLQYNGSLAAVKPLVVN